MSNQTGTVEGSAADVIPDFEALYPRQTTFNGYSVLSLSDGELTAYQVDVSNLDCDCPDSQMNRDDPEICKHLAAALIAARKTRKPEEFAMQFVSRRLTRLESAVNDIEGYRTALEADVQHAATAGAADEAEDGDDDADLDPVALLDRALEDAAIDPANVEAWIDDEYNSLQFRADDMPDDEFERFREWCQDIGGINWDRDNRRNYVKQGDIAEVLG